MPFEIEMHEIVENQNDDDADSCESYASGELLRTGERSQVGRSFSHSGKCAKQSHGVLSSATHSLIETLMFFRPKESFFA